ncbi:helix-turn-helix domain-containing protein [Weissella viridescens]|uniref:helix-turn-helix domain-containing protein n=1 Tax=Weissella viridescens TaxID=1629 RepID=UPI001D06963C|nr:helix-turn-helix domain-containing protein [Weissella viridescens]MCB6839906.1 helix-turn-helix domain-containing protein [Weissella viridescens]MCB6846638.1 helix-turn-helix domain-containing protein [Weissella viridescens]
MAAFDRIKKVSKDRGYSLYTVNEKAGLGKNVIYGWRTKKPDYDNLKAVADVLGVSVDYLLGNTDEMHPKQADASKPTEVNLDEALQDKGMVMKFNGKDLSDTAKRGILNILEMLEEGKNDSK